MIRHLARSILLALIAAAAPVAAGDDPPRIVRWAVSPSTAACLGIQQDLKDLYVLELPRAANVTLELTPADPSANCDLLLMAVDGEKTPRAIAASSGDPRSSKRIATLLSPGTYYIGVSAAGEWSAYALTLSAPELFGNSSVDIAEKTSGECAPDARATVTVIDPLSDTTTENANPETAYEAIAAAEDVAIDAVNTSRRRAALHPPPCTYAVSAATQSVTSTAGGGSLDVTTRSDCGWTARSNTSWLTITSGQTGVGNGPVSYSFLANTSSSSRTGTLTVAGKTVSITQLAACSYTLSPTSKDFPSAGGTGTFSVTTRADCAWTATVSTTATWLTITAGQSGTGNGTVAYTAAPNTSTSSRSGTITVGNRSVTIRESPDVSSCTYSFGYTSKTMTWCGGERTIQVTTQGDCPWTATSDSPWLTIILPSRTGSRALSYTVASNTTGSSREAKLTIAGTQIRIIQNARSGNGTYDGNWSGTTSGNRSVSMCVADNAIQNAAISVRLSFVTFTCTTPLIRQQELALTGSTFSGTFTTYPEVSNVFTTVRGTFTSPTAVNGSWDAFSQSYFIVCGSTIGFGTGGTILSAGTFTATKQP